MQGTRKKLAMFDVDGTLLTGEVIEMLAAHVSPEVEFEVQQITEAAMRGDYEFAESLTRRVALLKGLRASAIDEVGEALELAPGAHATVIALQRNGYYCGAVSGGFIQVIQKPLVERLGLDFGVANELEIVDGRLTGKVLGKIIDREAKATELNERVALYNISPGDTVAFGDGDNDVEMFNAAAKGIAVPKAKLTLRLVANHRLENSLIEALPYLGVSTADIKAAEAEAMEMAAQYEAAARRAPIRAHRTPLHGLPGHTSIGGTRAAPRRL